MPKKITLLHEKKIAQMIRHWPDDHDLDWNSICTGAQNILEWSTPPTRQALDKKPSIKVAYKARKEQLKAEQRKQSGMAKPRSTLDAMKRISRLQEENDLLRAELSKMAEVANRLIYNATIEGLSRDRLMAALPTIHEPPPKQSS
ncbi:TPA: hypothetical protein SL247_003578 [Pseudomonas aeruginosa]|uniref:hypothetical protein n=1 Tax=Pseudomonas aeruginosa TaxID=287 RepID=UPI000F53313C|nr:hypothetical protein [Pseudomonas aeruginosa]HEM7588607.1 hypothetical protein [Serratia marcescens]EKV4129616.1 hypothetical protein [Pseudomonas aeruginosa]EKW1534067.1 hypothetical protein [Pseudomonas aeruginosa]ELQ7976426.1 hypothetical protein [Pseudomonas aeruginosa]ELV3001076.1 hypothetical protein [Pseudomonas aeruginosa]